MQWPQVLSGTGTSHRDMSLIHVLVHSCSYGHNSRMLPSQYDRTNPLGFYCGTFINHPGKALVENGSLSLVCTLFLNNSLMVLGKLEMILLLELYFSNLLVAMEIKKCHTPF